MDHQWFPGFAHAALQNAPVGYRPLALGELYSHARAQINDSARKKTVDENSLPALLADACIEHIQLYDQRESTAGGNASLTICSRAALNSNVGHLGKPEFDWKASLP